ncbi:hypothetical protein BURPS668_A1632 [Burkholderia pseudomallei 668]|nr:hypothetical protein BURPS668_A1632 [Burkholderia pseudomallei 668]
MHGGNWNAGILRDSRHFRQCGNAQASRTEFFQRLRIGAIHVRPHARARRRPARMRVPSRLRVARASCGAVSARRKKIVGVRHRIFSWAAIRAPFVSSTLWRPFESSIAIGMFRVSMPIRLSPRA